LEDRDGRRLVIVTLDLIGVLHELRSHVATAAMEQFQLPPEALLMNASHTHCGPDYGHETSRAYFETLKQTLVQLVGDALAHREPATLSYSIARCSVAMNRRTPTATGYRNHPNPEGPVDHAVPVLSVHDASGDLKAVLFGYAC